jgi:hypothetical protein
MSENQSARAAAEMDGEGNSNLRRERKSLHLQEAGWTFVSTVSFGFRRPLNRDHSELRRLEDAL